MPMKKIYLLDRNVVSIIKDSNSEKPQKGKKLELLNKIRFRDDKRSIFSPLLSILEGQHGRRETKEEINATIEKESKHIKTFFKHAIIDSDFLIKNNELISDLISKEREIKSDEYMSFLGYASRLIYQPLSEDTRKATLADLIKHANSLGIPLGHPVFMCCVATIFGSQEARKVVKPKKEKYDAHNALSDIILISRINNIKLLKRNNEIILKFITLDHSLEKFISMVSVIEITPSSDGCFQRLSYNRKLFPCLGESEYQNLMKQLGGEL